MKVRARQGRYLSSPHSPLVVDGADGDGVSAPVLAGSNSEAPWVGGSVPVMAPGGSEKAPVWWLAWSTAGELGGWDAGVPVRR